MPWIRELLLCCFMTFEVAFWDSKSDAYLAEVIFALMEMLTTKKEMKPCFVWFGKHYAPTKYNDGAPTACGRPLEKVFEQYPYQNYSNTVIVDHKAHRVDCNLSANIIISTPFYMEKLKRLGDDQSFLKLFLWPFLQGLFGSTDVADFCSHFAQSVQDSAGKVSKLHEKEKTYGILVELQDEGIPGRMDQSDSHSSRGALHFGPNFDYVFVQRASEKREIRNEGSSTKGEPA